MTITIIIVALILIAFERSSRLRFRPAPLLRRYFISDVVYLMTGFVAGSSLVTLYFSSMSRWIGTGLGLPRLAGLNPSLFLSVPAALLLIDIGNYAAHYLLHRYELLWEFHKVHHSSALLDWLATFRSHLIEQALRRLIAPALLVIIGFPAAAVAAAGSIFIAWAMFNHSNINLDLRFLEIVFITPRLHRIHHRPESSDRNLGTVFTFWDRIRGTLLAGETAQDTFFGNGEPNYPQGWLAQLIEPVLRVLRLGRA